MDAITCINTRRTAPIITGPEPTPAELRTILHAATLAPDHKLLRPWRFIIVRGEARGRLAEALVAAAKAQDPQTPDDAIKKLTNKPMRAPLLLAVVASPKPGAKAPKWEQHASAAAAAENICLAAHALGLASAWKSTHLGDAPAVTKLLGMSEHEDLFGWIELGHLPVDFTFRERPGVALADVTSELTSAGLAPYRE